jgi:flagellar basal-body rod protein FlgB
MLISDLIHDGATPTLEAMVRFAGARQRMIANNIANISTPNYQQTEVNPLTFQRSLSEAVERRRGERGGTGPLQIRDTDQFRQERDGSLTLTPLAQKPSRNILFHDRNNRGIEELMADQAENMAAFRVASDLLKSRHDLMRMAIAERV